MKKLFISCPMRGRSDEDIKKTREKMHKVAEILFDEELEVINSYFEDAPNGENHALWYLGAAIQLMSGADYVIGVSNACGYNGCEIEKDIARRYKIPYTLVDVCEVAPDCAEKIAKAVDGVFGLGLSGFGGR